MTETRRVVVTGRVQGVGYRAWAMETARLLALRGWVRNRHDGTVEILATGPGDAVDRLIQACHGGPRGASVDAVRVEPAEPDLSPGFSWRETA